jgi:teichoic acid transport system permease protein
VADTDLGARAAEVPPSAAPSAALTPDQLARLVSDQGLRPIGVRPSIPAYVRQMWQRRHFVVELSRARDESENADSRLGKLWSLLNPILNTLVYFLVFGLIFQGRGTVENYIAFLVIGVFIFTYTQKSIRTGAGAIVNNITLVRALHFPRALLPLSTVIEELLTLGPSLLICFAVVLLTGEGIHWAWLLLIPALLLQSMFNTGLVFIFARMTERVRDVAKLLPFMLRTWFYVSGVVFPIGTVVKRAPEWVAFLLQFNPAAVFVELARDALLQSYSVPPITWVYAVFWGVVTLVVGFVYFWKAEEKYGRG